MRTHRIVTIPGDGIGPELVRGAVAVLETAQASSRDFKLHIHQVDAGASQYSATGSPISDEGLAACAQADAILKGPVGLPEVRRPDGTEGGLLGGTLRTGLDLFANVRPIKLWPGVTPRLAPGVDVIDYVIVRENTEGLYASRNLGIINRWAASDTLLMTRPGVERIVRFAFGLARTRAGAKPHSEPRVTCVDKANVLKSFAFFREIFDTIAQEFPEIEVDHLYTDAAAQALVMYPARFDVLVMENFVGDMLSDLGGATVGGVGMCPSGNVGVRCACFEPIHGSAPDLAGKDLANPLAQVLSGAMMLDHLGERMAANLVREATSRALATAAVRIAEDGTAVGGTCHAIDAIRREVIRLSHSDTSPCDRKQAVTK